MKPEQESGQLLKMHDLHPMQIKEFPRRNIKTSIQFQGSMRTSLRHPSRDFESSRRYIHGDPVNKIDWKAYARNDQLIIREKRDEASSKTHICLQHQESMNWPKSLKTYLQQQVATKFEIAARVALHLAHTHLRMGDSVYIWKVNSSNKPQHLWQPRSPSDVLSAFSTLHQQKFSPKSLTGLFKTNQFGVKKSDYFYWVGDTLGLPKLDSFLTIGRKNVLFHTLSSLELDFTWTNDKLNYCNDTSSPIEFPGRDLKENSIIKQEISNWLNKREQQVFSKKGLYLLLTESSDLGQYLNFLNQIAT